jgi:subtilisin family serine protease
MKKLLTAGLATSAFALSLGLTWASAQESVSVSAADKRSNLWFVELSGKPTTDGGSVSHLAAEKSAFRNAASAARVEYSIRRSYNVLFNGFSVEAGPKALEAISRLPGVKAVYPVEIVSLPPEDRMVGGEVPELSTAIAMTGADIVQDLLGFDGSGVKVAVMDTGIDYDHPDLGGCFGPGCRVAFGTDFVGDDFNADPTSPSFNPVPVPDDDPDDCNGHGTHVSGIVGASGDVTGVAPGVTFGAYRVFGCEGSTTSEIMISAMEAALADGADVLNMSIGSAFQWPQYPTAQAASRLVSQGVVVVTSIGNNGTSGLYAAGAPGVGKNVIGTASFDNTHVTLSTFTVSPDDTVIGYTPATAAAPTPTSGTEQLARTGTTTTANDGCNAVAPPAGSLTDRVALIRRGTCSFFEKALNAQTAGAIGVVLYNNAAGFVNPTVAGATPITIPVVAVTAAEGALLDGRIEAGDTFLTWTDQRASFPNPTGGTISGFSSYGLAADLSFKPDIASPGGSIFSTYPIESGEYATISGTSMASPHVAGVAALLLEKQPTLKPAIVAARLQNSADPKNWWGNPSLGFLDNAHRQGAGMVDAPGAVLATAHVTPSDLGLGESSGGPATRTLTISNRSPLPQIYDLSAEAALATGPSTFAPSFLDAPATVEFSSASVVVPARSSASFDVTITPNAGLLDRSIYGGYIKLTPQLGGSVLRVPFAGFVGDYQGSIQVLTPTANNFPWLAKLEGPNFVNQPAGASYTLAGGDNPFFLAHFDHQSRRLKFEVWSTSGRFMGYFEDNHYMPRNSGASSFFAFEWDGTTSRGAVPDGTYVVRISVLKALGNVWDPAHNEFWVAPPVTIDRP